MDREQQYLLRQGRRMLALEIAQKHRLHEDLFREGRKEIEVRLPPLAAEFRFPENPAEKVRVLRVELVLLPRATRNYVRAGFQGEWVFVDQSTGRMVDLQEVR